jgi:hypothetical protein
MTPQRQLYLMTNMMNGHALTSEEALEVWTELDRLHIALACAEQPQRVPLDHDAFVLWLRELIWKAGERPGGRENALLPSELASFLAPHLEQQTNLAAQRAADECNAQHAAMHDEVERNFAEEKNLAVAGAYLDAAKYVASLKGGYSASIHDDILVPDVDGPWILNADAATGIAARTPADAAAALREHDKEVAAAAEEAARESAARTIETWVQAGGTPDDLHGIALCLRQRGLHNNALSRAIAQATAPLVEALERTEKAALALVRNQPVRDLDEIIEHNHKLAAAQRAGQDEVKKWHDVEGGYCKTCQAEFEPGVCAPQDAQPDSSTGDHNVQFNLLADTKDAQKGESK